MEVALEKGLAAEKVKLGSGNKAPGYAFKKVTILRVIGAVFALAAVLATGMGFSIDTAVRDRYKLYMAQKSFSASQLKGDAASIAQNLQLEAALSMQTAAKEDVMRLLKRIRSVTSKKIEDAKALISDPKLAIQLGDTLSQIEMFIDSERADYEREFAEAEAKRRQQIEKLQQKQKEALQKLLTRVTDVRLEALEDMLDDLFARVSESVEVALPEHLWARLEDLVDRLYQEDLSVSAGLAEFNKEFRPHFGAGGVPAELAKRLEQAKNQGDMADVLDEIYEGAQIFSGREQLKKIHATWDGVKKRFSGVDQTDEKQLEAAEKIYSKATVDAVLQVQELINQGLIPQDFLDFDGIDLEVDDEEDDEDEDAFVKS